MEAIISIGLSLLSQVAPFLSTTGAVGTAIKFISAVLPPAVQLVKSEIPVVQGIITTLKGNKHVTADQLAELDRLDDQCDAVLNAAIEKAEQDDKAT